MKKIIAIVCCCAAAAFFTSCQKEVSIENFPLGPDSTRTDSFNRVKTYTETIQGAGLDTSLTFNLAYDTDGKLVSMTSTSNPGDKFVYSFPAANRYTMDIYNSNLISIHVDFMLNNNLLVDSSFQYNDTQDSSTEKYVYDGSNQLIAIKNYEINDGQTSLTGTATFTYNNDGDCVSSTDENGETVTSTYYTDQRYSPLLFPGYPNSITAKKMHLRKTLSTASGYVVTFTYTFDNLNRIIKETATGNDGTIVTKSYTYE